VATIQKKRNLTDPLRDGREETENRENSIKAEVQGSGMDIVCNLSLGQILNTRDKTLPRRHPEFEKLHNVL
jgi:hypothetical protein